ncbi:4Fe-4S ferredoxin iron-sulfur binding domain protein [Desulfofarcimen acetoxidans DSM 771]|uniref:4Fe-4S ferredoxin iron-sulfur binding domain protein n=1 Tax=Desulfofarcimen acetoxidans (strain ATCC 49208 / DSM 771 / KCTC 5769 / VKM B-1644 / 5575) TaxID=485916 RepID=C8VW01_DESAS|nr:CoB--CoM heterodisulfide reductase iron-sulfur subunit A family protein [Desulfofarcimen acetoxidans]ACV64288.1 4Fe-4S ferredoxin iron-sulfur binding domain protein [Desulfofarcimen acetoxidans DSM 771]
MANKSILVVGGGISGLTTAVEAAEVGYEVYIVEQKPYLGGKVAQINQYFPKLCPPNCGLEINFQRIRKNPNITFYTMAEVEAITGQEGNFTVTVKQNPRFVNENCTGCNKCTEACPADRANTFNYGIDKTKAIYLPHEFSFPQQYVIDAEACLGKGCTKCVEACAYNAIDVNMQAKSFELNVGAIVYATGWNSYDVTKLAYYGGGQYANVITNTVMERMAATNGPTQGKIVRPSDGKEINSIAFIQCAGSRDENHLSACSTVCCMASLKQATYVRDQYPDAKISIFYIDIRTRGRHEDFFNKVQNEANVTLVKGKAGELEEDPETKDITVIAEDQMSQQLMQEKFDLVVLATGMYPATADTKIPFAVDYDKDGFVASNTPGIYGAGCVKSPMDVSASVKDATAAALKAIQSTVRG